MFQRMRSRLRTFTKAKVRWFLMGLVKRIDGYVYTRERGWVKPPRT